MPPVGQETVVAFHEAAHALAACSIGRLVTEATIVEVPASDYAPGSLGHVCLAPLVDPKPEDLWLDSSWVEHQAMIWLAGYLVEDVLFPDDDPTHPERNHPRADHGRIASLLRVIAPSEPEAAADKVRQLRRKCFDLLELPGQIETVRLLAERLMEDKTLGQHEVYQLSSRGECGAIHPHDPSIRCSKDPHPFGEHWTVVGPPPARPGLQRDMVFFDGLPLPDPHLRVTAMPGSWRRVRGLIRGGPGPRLPRAWLQVLDACNDLPVLS